MKRNCLLFLAIVMFGALCNPCNAQKSKSGKKNNVSVDLLMQEYKFDEAIEVLEDELEVAEKKKRPTQELEAKLERANSLSAMLSATAKVFYIDSIVVDKKTFLPAIQLSDDCGVVASASSLVSEDLGKDKSLGMIAYQNELQDKIFFSLNKEKGLSGLHVSVRTGDSWGAPKALQGIAEEGAVQDFPYVLSDGVTMYYAQKDAENGLGGYDIYVSRYNPNTDKYLKPENIGMPFNSTANDYLYVIDEVNHIGWFATDRNQPEGKVCIYIFQPSETREVYNRIAVGDDWLRQVAKIHSIKDNMLNKKSLEKARETLKNIEENKKQTAGGSSVRYIIDDQTVYTSLLQFKSDEAQRLAMEWMKAQNKLYTESEKLEKMRQAYHHDKATEADKSRILSQESLVEALSEKVSLLSKNMRKAELSK